MDIVTAGMHDAFILGSKGQPCFFPYRQGIHIGAKGNQRAL